MKAAAVTGLRAEARIACRFGFAAAASGGVAARTRAACESFLKDGAPALLSFGIAGALAPPLASGTLLLPRTVIEESGIRHPVDGVWRSRVEAVLAGAGLRVESGDMLGAAQAADTAERKAALFRSTGAVAIDLESHLIAQVAAQARRPFLVLRAVADPALRTLPPAAVNGLDENGAPALGRVLASVLRHPGQVPALLRLAGDTRCALSALSSALETGAI